MTQTTHDAGELFSGKPSGTTILGYSDPSVYTPKIDPMYAFHESSRDVIVWFLMEKADPLYVYGPSGCGKSSQIRQIAARLNYPVFEATGHDRLEFPDLIGHLSVQNGNMEFQDGPLTMAMKQGGIFLFNEAEDFAFQTDGDFHVKHILSQPIYPKTGHVSIKKDCYFIDWEV